MQELARTDQDLIFGQIRTSITNVKIPTHPRALGKRRGKGAVVSVLPASHWMVPWSVVAPYWSRLHWSLSWLLRSRAQLGNVFWCFQLEKGELEKLEIWDSSKNLVHKVSFSPKLYFCPFLYISHSVLCGVGCGGCGGPSRWSKGCWTLWPEHNLVGAVLWLHHGYYANQH